MRTMETLRPLRAKYLGLQPRMGGQPPVPLFTLEDDIPGHCAGSTVSGPTLREAGYDLPSLPCMEDAVRGCPEPGVYLVFWPSAPGVLAPDVVVVCKRHVETLGELRPSALGPVIVPLETALNPIGTVT